MDWPCSFADQAKGKARHHYWVVIARRRVAGHMHTLAMHLVKLAVRSESKSAGVGQADRS